jgi:RHS repeat-associated protein
VAATVAPVPGSIAIGHAASNPTNPNRFDSKSNATSVNRVVAAPQSGTAPANSSTPTPFAKDHHFALVPTAFAITPSGTSHFVSNDKTLTIDVPVGTVTQAEAAADGGKTSLLVRQIQPGSGSSAGGSGHVSFGGFLVQIIDAHGHLAKHGLHQALKFTLHYGKGTAVDLSHAYTVLNAPLPAWVNPDPASVLPTPAPTAASSSRLSAASSGDLSSQTSASLVSYSPTTATLGPQSNPAVRVDAAASSLITTVALSTPSSSISWGTDSPVATFGKPDPFEVQLSGGSLTTGYPLDVPAGPGGFTPPVSLVYNSAGVSDQHNAQGAAGWVGEGWNMSLGAISWAEHNVLSGDGSSQWEDNWQLNDAFGTSAEIIPPNLNVATYYDDSPNSQSTSPVPWHTAPETHAKVFSYDSGISLPGMPAVPPCFRVFLANGVMEEFGCTADSLQFYPNLCAGTQNNTCDYLANWNLDLITDPQGNQIHITYQTDTESARGFNYPRDAEMATIEYDSPGCLNAQTACTGSAWAPLMRVNFSASHSVAHVSGSSCAANGNLRCDDPVDLSGSGGLAAPIVQSTFALNDIQVQVRSSGTASWNTLHDYQLSYDQAGPSTITDPVSGLQESTAGRLNLTQLKVLGDDGSTALPAVNYGYASQTESYVDSLQQPVAGSGCGFSWNVPCNLWSESYAGNSYYMTSASNGLGLAQTFSWQNAHDNMHGVNGGGATNTQNPFYCNGTGVQNSYPCYSADDEAWSRMVLTQQTNSLVRLSQAGQGGQQTSTPVTGTTTYNYQVAYPLLAQECSDCVAGYTWGNQNDNDYLDFYNGKFMGFTQASVGNPDGSVEIHKYYSTEGWGVYDTTQITCFENPPNPCHNDAWWDLSNAAHAHEYELDRYATDGATLLQQVKTQYSAVCPPAGVTGSPAVSGYGNWNGNLVSELDHGNPVGVCDVQTTGVDNYTYDGATGTVPDLTQTYAYDSYGRPTSETDASNNGSANGSPTTILHKTSYIWNDAVTATSTSATGTYLIEFPAFADTEDSSGNRYQCSYTSYDGQANATGQSNGLTLGETTRIDNYTNCGNSGNGFTPSGQISTTATYDSFGNKIAGKDADANAGNTAHVGCAVGASTYSSCTNYDTTFNSLATAQANALNQISHVNYQAPASGTAGGGFGLWPISTSDLNSQTTAFTYDALGRQTSVTLPAESAGLTTQSMAYTVWCSGTAAQSPCAEIDQTQRLNSTTTVTNRAFYDGMGHLVETRSPGPSGDVVQYSYYDPSQRQIFKSVPYIVASYTGAPGAAAYSIPDSAQAGTSSTYDGLGRTTSSTDALSEQSNLSYAVACNAAGTGDSACYEQTAAVDPLGHKTGQLVDALQRAQFEQRYTGNAPANYAVYATTKHTYDYAGDLIQILQPDGATKTTYQYDMAGRKTGMTDPDRGTETYAYDQNGNPTQSIDARGAGGTVYAGFDGIDRPIWRNTTNSPTGAYDTYSYDSTASGNVGIGRLTSQTFSGAPNNTLSGSDSYVYDTRGRLTAETLAVGSTNYPIQATYDDAGTSLTKTYPDGETVTNSYSAQDWVTGVSTTQGSTTLLSGAGYTGSGGAVGSITSANLGGTTYQFNATYDLIGRASDIKVKRTSDQATMFDQARTFDGAGNVTTANTTMPAGSDNQAFCYDEQNRLTWAGAAGTPPCTGTAISAGTLTAAQYTQTFAYDTMGRLTGGPLGAYTYGDSAHVHAATSIGATYTAAYDAAGDMTCRAPSSGVTCSGTQSGAQLNFNNEGELSNWQNTPGNPTGTAAFLYDGQGNRVAQQSTQSGTSTTTVYVGNLEEDSTTGTTTTKTTYYYANGSRIAMAVNGAFSYLASDGLGSANVTLKGSGNSTASLLYAPYGSTRYSSGSMPTDYGFTGQHADSNTGFDYYNARYYDSTAGQFASPDAVLPGGGFDVWGLSPYTYVEGNPLIRTDPTGNVMVCDCGTDASNIGNPQPIYSPPSPKPLSFLTPVTNKVFDILNWATSPSVQRVNRGVSGVLDSWWDMAATVSPPGLMSDVGLGPDMRDPLAKLDRAMGGHESTTNEYQNGRVTAIVAQIGMVFTPEGATEDAGLLAEIPGATAKATESAPSFAVPLKHLPGAGGDWAKFAEGVDPNAAIGEALQSPEAVFAGNGVATSFRVISNLGRVVGSRGETSIRVVVDLTGRIITAFPVR